MEPEDSGRQDLRVPSAVLAMLLAAAFALELILAVTNTVDARMFTPMTLQLPIVLTVSIVALALSRRGLVRRLLLAVLIPAGLLTSLLGYSVWANTTSRPESVCIAARRELTDSQLREADLGDSPVRSADIDFHWDGSFTCHWLPDDDGFEGASHDSQVWSLLGNLGTIFS